MAAFNMLGIPNFPKTRRFSDIRLQSAVTLKTGLAVREGH